MRVSRLLVSLIVCPTLAVTAGCAATVSLEAAPDATDPLCASVIVSLPDTLSSQSTAVSLDRRTVSAQATAAWGNPSAVVLRCGVPVPDPTTDACIEVNGIDWILVDQQDETWRFVSYGRTPATEVTVDATQISGESTLSILSDAVAKTTQTSMCLASNDVE